MERSEVGVTQPNIEGQIMPDFPIVLGKKSPQIFTVVLSNPTRNSCHRIEVAGLLLWSVVEEVPDIEEAVLGDSDRVVEVAQVGIFAAELNRMRAQNFGSYILVGVGPLIQIASNGSTKKLHLGATHRRS